MATRLNNKHMWTKNEIKTLVTVWEDKSLDDMANELDLHRPQIAYMANQLRKAGIKLSKKHQTGKLQALIHEVKKELNLR